jgi:DNA-binding SARP family transcriptional activator
MRGAGGGMTGPSIRITVLGAVRVFRDGAEVELTGTRPRLMLALLLARAGGTVTVAELIELLWPADPPAGAVNMIRRHAGAVRRALEPGLPFRAEGAWLAGVPGGYRLRADPATTDLFEFRALAARAAQAPHPADALPDWVAALSLWHGRYAAGLIETASTPAAFAAMDRERSAAVLSAGAAAREAGNPGLVLPQAREVAGSSPLDEVLAAEMIRLLVADGRRAEAEAWHRRTRDLLAEQLGITPGPALATALATTLDQQAAPAPARPQQLPSDLWLFGGRVAELGALTAVMNRAGVIAIDGIPGVGKTTLAVHWSHLVAGRFPDGQLFANLRGYDPSGEPADPEEILGAFLDALGVPPPEIPEGTEARAGLFRTLTAERRLLIVLDNARTAEQVRPLIPAAPGSLVLITSRTRLSGLAARLGATLIGLDLPSPAEARADLRRREPYPDPRDEDLDQVVALCGRLPLAVSIVAARAEGRSGGIAELLAELHASRDSLDAFEDDEPGGVRAVFSWSYRQLSPEAARLFRLLPTHTGPDAGLPLLASLAGVGARPAARLVRELVQARLILEHRPGRYTQHDLIAVYATELAAQHETPAALAEAAGRLLDHFTRTLQRMNQHNIRPLNQLIDGVPLPGVEPERFDDALQALAWFRAELDNLRATVLDAYRGGRSPWPTVMDSFDAHLRLGRIEMWADLGRPALAAAVAAGDRPAEAHLRRLLGNVVALHDRDAGTAEYLRALDLFEGLGAKAEQAAVLVKLAEMWSQLPPEPDYARAVPYYERAVELYTAAEHEVGRRNALVWLGRCRLELGRTAEGVAILTEALDAYLCDGLLQRTAVVFLNLGAASGRSDAADFLLMANRLFRDSGNGNWALITDLMLGEAYLEAGRRHDARAAWQRSSDAIAALSAEGAYLSPETRIRFARFSVSLGR